MSNMEHEDTMRRNAEIREMLYQVEDEYRMKQKQKGASTGEIFTLLFAVIGVGSVICGILNYLAKLIF